MTIIDLLHTFVRMPVECLFLVVMNLNTNMFSAVVFITPKPLVVGKWEVGHAVS